ncbi:NAD(P)-binding protein [Trametes maxima]|nr:NAD(P)-binding protein [Trametes maxima]
MAFLTDFKETFKFVRVLSRDPSSVACQELSKMGAILHRLSESDLPRNLDEAFQDADIIVNVLPTHKIVPLSTHREIVEAVARSQAKVYFPSDFGSDYRNISFPGYEHPEWSKKAILDAESRERLKGEGRKVISVFTSIWAEYALSPKFLGIDVKSNTYTVYGPPTTRFSSTSKVDVGRAVVRFAMLSLDPMIASKVPDYVRIAGSTVSYEEVRDIVARVKDVPRAEIKSEDREALKEHIRQDPGKHFTDYVHVMIGEGRADFSTDNTNELINPAESLWKWKTIEDHVREL